MIRALALIGISVLAGCASGRPYRPAEVQTSTAVIAIVGFDDALKHRFSGKIPDGEGSAALKLIFQQDVAPDACTDGFNDPRKLPGIAMFQESASLEVALDDGRLVQAHLLNASDTGMPRNWQIAAGDYGLRDVAVSWEETIGPLAVGENSAWATSSKYTLTFRSDGGPTFLGLYEIGLTAQDEVVLTAIPAPEKILVEAARQLGFAGKTLPQPAMRVSELKRCGLTGGIRITKSMYGS